MGSREISLDRNTKAIVSRPYGYTNSEAENNLTQRILERLRAKNAIAYPPDTVLVIQCILDRLFLEDEWNRSVEQARQLGLKPRFSEVFLCAPVHNYSATMWNVKSLERYARAGQSQNPSRKMARPGRLKL